MLPAPTSDYLTNCLLRDIEPRGKGRLRMITALVETANISDGRFRELAVAVLLPPCGFVSKCVIAVRDILGGRCPLKVREAVVRRIAVNVIDFRAGKWRGADMSQHDQSVQPVLPLDAVFVERNVSVAPLVVIGCEDVPGFGAGGRCQTHYSPKIADRVDAFVTRNRLKDLSDAHGLYAFRATQLSSGKCTARRRHTPLVGPFVDVPDALLEAVS